MTKTAEFKFDLEDRVKCRFTKFEGIVTSRSEWLGSEPNYGVRPLNLKADGGIPDLEYMNAASMELVQTGSVKL